MKQLETTGYYAFGVPLYVALVIVESLVARRRGQSIISFADSFGNIAAGLGSIVIGLFLGPALIALYCFAYDHFALVHWPAASWVAFALAIVLADFGHYWHHRLDHRVAACWAIHGVHHHPVEMNFTVGMRHAWFSDLYSFPFYAPLPLLGVPVSYFFAATTLLSVHALLTHSATYNFPGFYFLVTPRSHIVHHAKNQRYLDKNFGAMLCIWDRLFGTHVDLDPAEPPVYGTLDGYKTHDGALAQWVPVRELLALVRQTPKWRDKLRVLFNRPGWTPPGAVPVPAPPLRLSAQIPVWTKVYVSAQFLLTGMFSLYVFVLRDYHSLRFQLMAAVTILATLVTLGGLLDARRRAWRWEALRLGLWPAAAWALLVW